jgi:putative tricarboxylic transport membrane protein
MNAKSLIEGMIFTGIGLVGLFEGIRTNIKRNPAVVQDPLGADGYLIMIGVALIIAGIVHFIVNFQKQIDKKEEALINDENKAQLRMVVHIFSSLVVYCVLIYFIGYLVSTLIFFLLMFYIFKFKPYVNAILSVALAVIFYVLFEYLLTMSFPSGTLLNFL